MLSKLHGVGLKKATLYVYPDLLHNVIADQGGPIGG